MLTRKDLCDIYEELCNRDDLPEDAVSYLQMISDSCFLPDKLRTMLEHNMNMLRDHTLKGTHNERNEHKVLCIEELIKVLFSDYEDMPLCINETFSCIAKMRLEKSV